MPADFLRTQNKKSLSGEIKALGDPVPPVDKRFVGKNTELVVHLQEN